MKHSLRELRSVLDAARHVEDICKKEGFSIFTSQKCKSYIIVNVIGNAHSRQAKAGLKMLEYFEKEEKLLTKDMNINISVGKVVSTHRHTIHKSLSHILLSFILVVAKVMKKNEVHKFVNHKLVNFAFIYDLQSIKRL